jgi:hypothetical protein
MIRAVLVMAVAGVSVFIVISLFAGWLPPFFRADAGRAVRAGRC